MDSDHNEGECAILFVGEGDFSFSANYVLKYINNKPKEKIYATCFCSRALTERQLANIKRIEDNGGSVYADVDATNLESHPIIKALKFTKILFNFPHIPGKMNIRENRKLVQKFFISAEKFLMDNGTIWVTLCQGQGGTEIEKNVRKTCDTWQIVSLAASASLVLSRIKPFDVKQFETYECTGFRGQQKPFNTKGALTHIFCRGKVVNDVYENNDNITNADSVELLIKNYKNLHRGLSKNSCLPTLKVLSHLNDFEKEIFLSHQVFIYDLLICKNLFISPLNSDANDCTNMDFCEGCLSNLFLHFLNNRNGDCVTSVVCNICCVKNISINSPFCHVLTYFSSNSKLILTSLQRFLEHLNSEYSFNKNQDQPDTENCNMDTENEQIIETAIQNAQVNPCHTKVKNILNIYATYSKNKSDEFLFYSNVNFFLSYDKFINSKTEFMKIGNVIQYYDHFKLNTCILLNMDYLACLKYHIMDHRILFLDDSYYTPHIFCGYPQDVYRSFSIYPPTYVHDISFYTDGDFNENIFYIVVMNTLGFLIKTVTLLDSYYDNNVKKYSRCYRFIYQSYHQVVTKEKINAVHTQVMRKSLQNYLNISLR